MDTNINPNVNSHINQNNTLEAIDDYLNMNEISFYNNSRHNVTEVSDFSFNNINNNVNVHIENQFESYVVNPSQHSQHSQQSQRNHQSFFQEFQEESIILNEEESEYISMIRNDNHNSNRFSDQEILDKCRNLSFHLPDIQKYLSDPDANECKYFFIIYSPLME